MGRAQGRRNAFGFAKETAMHGFRDNEVLLPTGYEVIVSPPTMDAAFTFYDRF